MLVVWVKTQANDVTYDLFTRYVVFFKGDLIEDLLVTALCLKQFASVVITQPNVSPTSTNGATNDCEVLHPTAVPISDSNQDKAMKKGWWLQPIVLRT